jgi:hypothetical protein
MVKCDYIWAGATMRKFALGGLFLGMIMGSGLDGVNAAYVIRLKNGNEYVTVRYWQDGRQVLFDTYGGVFGIDRGFVAKIEKTDKPVRLARVGERDPSDEAQSDSAKPNKELVEAKPATEPKLEKTRDINDPVVTEYNKLKERAKVVDSLLTSEITDLLKEISAFKNKLAKDSKLFIEYGQEFNGAHEIGATVESALQARTQ